MKEKVGFFGMLKLGFTLALFAAGACVLLAFVYSVTNPIIVENQLGAMKAALKEMFPDADEDGFGLAAITSPDSAVPFGDAFEAKKDGTICGAALQAESNGFGGPVKILIGATADGTIVEVTILEHSETPGFGAKAKDDPTFCGQFAGKNLSDPFELGGDVEAISGSTITSKAVTAAVKASALGISAWLADKK